MTEQETRAILSICLMAAFADGTKDEREREQVRRVAATLTGDSAADLTAIFDAMNVFLGDPISPGTGGPRTELRMPVEKVQ